MSDTKPERVDAALVAGGRYHDIDYARLQLLTLLAEHPHVRVKVAADYEDTDAISASSFLVSYTCDIRPSEAAHRRTPSTKKPIWSPGRKSPNSRRVSI